MISSYWPVRDNRGGVRGGGQKSRKGCRVTANEKMSRKEACKGTEGVGGGYNKAESHPAENEALYAFPPGRGISEPSVNEASVLN